MKGLKVTKADKLYENKTNRMYSVTKELIADKIYKYSFKWPPCGTYCL